MDGCVTAQPWYLCGGETLAQQIAHASKGKARRFRKKFRKRQEGVMVAGAQNYAPAVAEAEELNETY